MNPNRRTFRQTFARRLGRNTAIVAGVLAGAYLALATTGTAAELDTPNLPEPAAPAERLERIIDRHDCYTGEAPDPNMIPEFAIVSTAKRGPHLVPSAVGFGIWLDGDPGTLHAFCP
jgi:hypothetical protein